MTAVSRGVLGPGSFVTGRCTEQFFLEHARRLPWQEMAVSSHTRLSSAVTFDTGPPVGLFCFVLALSVKCCPSEESFLTKVPWETGEGTVSRPLPVRPVRSHT